MSLDTPPDQHPVDLLLEWIAQARAAGARRPLAMALATATLDGTPSVRMVIARRIERAGITFYTDARSPKGRDLAAPDAEAFFAGYAPKIQRAMRVSTQSAPLSDRGVLESAIAADAMAYPDQGPIAPAFTGYRLAPAEMEFWAEADDALHDRAQFTRRGDDWRVGLLQP